MTAPSSDVRAEIARSMADILSDAGLMPRVLVIGLSGGVDSVLLLHALTREQSVISLPPLHAAYVNHGLSANAEAWQTHCEKLCASLGIPFTALPVNVAPAPRQSLEAVAREARYEALLTFCQQQSAALVLGQHLNDQCETVLIALKRGSGPAGLSAMPRWRKERGVLIARPMLNVRRDIIIREATDAGLRWIEDESNSDTRFDRNFLREDIIPLLNARWPQFVSTVGRSASLIAEQNYLFNEVLDERLARLTDTEHTLSIEVLMEFSALWQKQLIRHWILTLTKLAPSARVTDEILKVCSAQADRQPVVHLPEVDIRRFNGRLYAVPPVAEEPFSDTQLNPGESYIIPGVGSLHLAATDEQGTVNVTICSGKLTSPFKPAGSAHSKMFKAWLKLWQVPPWRRHTVPQIFHEDTLIGIVLNGELITRSDSGPALTLRKEDE